MTSREHARRLMLILLASEGTALRKAADDRMGRRERTRPARGAGDTNQGTGSTEASAGAASERALDEWRLWSAHSPVGAAYRVP
jgi:hypothetical protein